MNSDSDQNAEFQKILRTYWKYMTYGGIPIVAYFLYMAFSMVSSSGGDGLGLKFVTFLALVIVYSAGNIYFWMKLRCPGCGSFILFYFGSNLLELIRFRNCPRCGRQLRS